MMAGTIWTIVVVLLLLVRLLLAAVAPERAIRLNLWEMNVFSRLSGLRVDPIGGDIERYIAERKSKVRIVGLIGTAALALLSVFILSALSRR
jgi:hypothetical protein